ncbi:MAG: HEAT repeat domain-containing protein, partial [Planctomycetia bacterium]|nr:HEAT repeat domain-containing protein [Planctomycetia bacterium]
MTRLFAAFGVCALAIGVAAGGPTPTPATPPPSVSELITQLGSDQFREREAATAALEKAGASAIPALKEAVKSPDPEVRQRASVILLKLQRSADSSARLAPKKVAMNYRDVPLGTAVNDLKTRTGLNSTIDPKRVANPLRPITCVSGELPAWEALEVFCAAAGLKEVFLPELEVPKPQPPGGRRGYVPPPQIPVADAVPITLIDGKAERLPGSRTTAVRVLALPSAFPGHRVTLGTGEITFCFDIAPAPGLNWQDVVGVKINKLIDDSGRFGGAGSKQPAAPVFNDFEGGVVVWGGGFGGPGMIGGPGMRFDPVTGNPIPPESLPNTRIVPLELKLGTPTARSLKRLEGVVLGEIQLTNQPLITVLDPAKQTGHSFNGPGQVRLTVISVKEPKDTMGAVIQVQLEYPSPYS